MISLDQIQFSDGSSTKKGTINVIAHTFESGINFTAVQAGFAVNEMRYLEDLQVARTLKHEFQIVRPGLKDIQTTAMQFSMVTNNDGLSSIAPHNIALVGENDSRRHHRLESFAAGRVATENPNVAEYLNKKFGNVLRAYVPKFLFMGLLAEGLTINLVDPDQANVVGQFEYGLLMAWKYTHPIEKPPHVVVQPTTPVIPFWLDGLEL